MTNDPNAPIHIPVGFQFTPQSGGGALPDYGASRTPNPYLQSGYSEQIGPVRTTVIPLRSKGQQVSGLYYFRQERFNNQGGYRQLGTDKDYHASRSSGSLDARFKDQGILTQFTNTTSTSLNINEWSVHHTNIFGRLVVAMRKAGGGGETYLWIDQATALTNPFLAKLSYSQGAGHDITGLTNVTFAGVNYLAVQFGEIGSGSGAAVQLLSDVAYPTPTIFGSMHADTKSCWGMVVSPDPTAYLIMNSAASATTSSIRVMAPGAAYNSQPTVTISQLPVGGYAIGLLAIGGPPLRAYFNIPPLGGSVGVASQPGGNTVSSANSNDYKGRIVSVNARGFDLQEYGRSQMPLNNVPLSSGFRDGLLGSDTDRLIFSNLIRAPKDLRLGKDRFANSSRQRKIMGWWTRNNYDLYVLEEETSATVGGDGAASRFQVQYYDFDQDEWTPVSTFQTEQTTGLQCWNPTGTFPVSDGTGYMHMLSGQNPWNLYWQFQPPPATNPYQYRQTSGAGATSGTKFATAGQDVSALMTLSGLPGAILEPHRCYWGGQGDEGTVKLTVGGMGDSGNAVTLPAVIFTSPINAASRYRPLAPTRLQNLQFTIDVTQGATVYKTPQVYPIAVEGIAYIDDSVYAEWSKQGRIQWS